LKEELLKQVAQKTDKSRLEKEAELKRHSEDMAKLNQIQSEKEK